MIRSFARKLTKSFRRHGILGTFGVALAYTKYHLWALTPARRRARERDGEFDRQFGVDTKGIVELSTLDFDRPCNQSGHRYQATPPALVLEMLAALGISYADFIFVDIGSGKGRSLLLASSFPFKKIVGVEFAPQLHAIAARNIQRYKNDAQRCANLESVCLDATVYPIPDEPVVFYLYNPFEEDVMRKVLENIKRSFDDYPRPIYVIYHDPLFSKLIEQTGFLRPMKTGDDYIIYQAISVTSIGHDASTRSDGESARPI